jgi:tetratricopeptide (TPR) repeat protein
MASNRLPEAKELFEQIASNRSWRGEATAQSIYSLGQILVMRGSSEDLAQAQAHFQRVYISYKKFTPWVAKAYISSGETFEKLGQIPEAIATYKEMIRNQDRFENYPELAKARERLRVLEQSVPATTGGAS